MYLYLALRYSDLGLAENGATCFNAIWNYSVGIS